ncbi:CPBP family intramembrane glutamic endopeptidase [Lentilactobacillus otakiensis]|nr:CPBP family intramembrane glutamic endopeptidase [Lentilactobacillus otakiensis]MDV3517760.1 CPBP family intramembrane glutamic endopeptidase [Lentilactobacillus otakiensis]
MTKNRMLLVFKLECFLAFIIIGTAFLLKSSSSQSPQKEIIIAGISLVFGTCLQAEPAKRLAALVNNLLRIILVALFPFTLMSAISILAHPFIGTLSIQKWTVLIISLVVFIFLLIPYVQLVIVPTSGITLRILTAYVLTLSFTSIAITSKTFGFQFSYTAPIVPFAIISIFVILIYTMKAWGYKLPKLGINSKVSYWWLLLTIFTALLNFGMNAGSWARLFGHFDLALGQTSLVGITLMIVWTGFKEEFMFRYIALWALLTAKIKSDKNRILVAILISSGLFGISHASNILNGQSIIETFLQIFAAFGVGMLFSVITLYTGNIWIVVALHSMIDLIGYPMTNGGPFSGSMSSYEIEFIIITRIIELVVVFLMLNNHKVQEAFKQTLGNIRSTSKN